MCFITVYALCDAIRQSKGERNALGGMGWEEGGVYTYDY